MEEKLVNLLTGQHPGDEYDNSIFTSGSIGVGLHNTFFFIAPIEPLDCLTEWM